MRLGISGLEQADAQGHYADRQQEGGQVRDGVGHELGEVPVQPIQSAQQAALEGDVEQGSSGRLSGS